MIPLIINHTKQMTVNNITLNILRIGNAENLDKIRLQCYGLLRYNWEGLIDHCVFYKKNPATDFKE